LGSNRVVVNINSDVELQKAQEKQWKIFVIFYSY
jgi:hypothetical protein